MYRPRRVTAPQTNRSRGEAGEGPDIHTYILPDGVKRSHCRIPKPPSQTPNLDLDPSKRSAQLRGVTALSASLFHFRSVEAVAHNGLYSALAIPNVLKELVGWKTQ